MSTGMDPARDVHLRADGLRERARALNSITTRIRLFEKPVVARGFFGFKKKPTFSNYEVTLTAQETGVFYEWAMAKMREYEAEADRLDKTVQVKP